MLEGILIISVVGFLAGELAYKFKLPRLIGMLISGMIMGPYVFDILPAEILTFSEEIRLLVLLIILFKAGLGLDKDKILSQGTVAVRLGFLPSIIEASVIAVIIRLIFGWEWLIAWLLGWIICAASPAVIVPLMLKLKAEGWGVKKGIPDLVLAGGTASDATAVTMFAIFMDWITEGTGGGLLSQLANIPLQIILAIILGFIAGKLTVWLLDEVQLADNVVYHLIVGLGLAILLVLGDQFIPYSSYLAVMAMGFTVLETNPVLARQLRVEVDKIWTLGEIFLFVLIGAAANITVVVEAGLAGLVIIGIGLLIGRSLGIILSTWGSNITIPERLFMMVGSMPKATVQAAIAGIPLARGVTHGEVILAISVLAILVTAPLGAFGTLFFAPRILEKGKVDPTKITVKDEYKFMVALDGSKAAQHALKEAARIARQMDGELIVLNIHFIEDEKLTREKIKKELSIASDIKNKIIIKEGDPTYDIVQTAKSHQVDHIFIGKGNPQKNTIGDIAKEVTAKSSIPVVLVEN